MVEVREINAVVFQGRQVAESGARYRSIRGAAKIVKVARSITESSEGRRAENTLGVRVKPSVRFILEQVPPHPIPLPRWGRGRVKRCGIPSPPWGRGSG